MNKTGQEDFVTQLKNGLAVSGSKILERRTSGLAAIRRECLARLSRLAGLPADSSLIVRWKGLGELANARTVNSASFELRLHSGASAVSGSFPDLWIVCYPDDPQLKQHVEDAIDRMCDQAVAQKYPK